MDIVKYFIKKFGMFGDISLAGLFFFFLNNFA